MKFLLFLIQKKGVKAINHFAFSAQECIREFNYVPLLDLLVTCFFYIKKLHLRPGGYPNIFFY